MSYNKVDITPVKRDRYGRYVLPHPDTGKEQPWTRATTVANTLADRYGLEQWDQRNVVYGMAQRPDLVLRAAACKRDDNSDLDSIVKDAKAAAASTSAANVGTAIHQFIERIDQGEDLTVPAPYDQDVAAYQQKMKDHGIVVMGQMLERIVCLPVAGVAGTLDRVNIAEQWLLPRVGDIKTAQDGTDYEGRPYNKILKYGGADIPLQLAIYAHAEYVWEPASQSWSRLPDLDLDTAVVVHIPAGQAECRIYEVDIKAGWEAVQIALDERKWRNRKDLFVVIGDEASSSGVIGPSKGAEAELPAEETPASPPTTTGGESSVGADSPSGGDSQSGNGAGADPTLFEQRKEWLRKRVEVVKAHPEARSRLAALWKLTDIPTYPKGGPDDDNELDKIIGLVALVEMEHTLPFPDENDPALPTATKENTK